MIGNEEDMDTQWRKTAIIEQLLSEIDLEQFVLDIEVNNKVLYQHLLNTMTRRGNVHKR